MNNFFSPSPWLVRFLLAATLVTRGMGDEPTTLKQAYGDKFALGAAIPYPELTPAEQEVLLANFTNITPENCMKPESTEPEEGHYTFEKADDLVNFAQQHRLKVNGHCLVWYMQTPDWFFLDQGKPAGRELALKRMTDHITTEATHFKGKVFSWDVVNEALDDGPGYLRQSKWLKCIGPDYIAKAFAAAAKADPNAELYYNDYEIEKPAKRAKAIQLIRDLKKQHIRIDGIGIQGHWHLDSIPYQDLEDAIVAFHREGLKVMITEIDLNVMPPHYVHDSFAKGCPPEILQREADQYGRLFALFRKHADMISRVTFWGLDDERSWLNSSDTTNYPLLWGRDLQPKPALAAVLKAHAP
jgi:endo-1,4-beta-xylanase